MSNVLELEAMEEALRTAMLSADVAKLDELLDDELLFVGPDGGLLSKPDDLSRYRSGAQRLTAIDLRDKFVRGGVQVASVSVLARVSGSFHGRSFEGTFRYLRVWHRTANGWKVVAGSVAALNA